MTIKLWPDREIRVEKKRIGRVPVLILEIPIWKSRRR